MSERLNNNLNTNRNQSRNNNTRNCDRKQSSASVMQRARTRLRDKRMNALQKLGKRSGLINYEKRTSKSSQLSKISNSGSSSCGSGSGRLGSNNDNNNNWADMEYSERQNSVRTLDLFRYAKFRELVAIIVGILFMIYAASWQPISVFILAIMASLMGRYSKQASLLKNLNGTSALGHDGSNSVSDENGNEAVQGHPITSSSITGSTNKDPIAFLAHSLEHLASATINRTAGWLSSDGDDGVPIAHSTTDTTAPSLDLINHSTSMLVNAAAQSLDHHADQAPSSSSYDEYSLLDMLYSVVTPIFDLGSSTEQRQADENSLKAAVRVILERESTQFLRKSFEINGSAFVLALTQLFAFFLGLTLITWAAKKQASRIKLLYFSSCLHQEVTWFEAIDSASGSGSSLNGLVDKFEDGVGMKMALLCYFLGHIGLFALTAFYQMFSLAAFCMPFVLLIGIIIAYLSDWQAGSIGEHALFAKRSLQLAEEIIAAIRTVFAFNGQQKEITRYSLSLEPVYRKSLIKHLYTALNTSLSKFSIFACFSIYCFYAKHLFPPYSEHANAQNKATILAIMRGAEVSIVNILISIPFLEALQQSKGSITQIFVAIERRSKINVSSMRGHKLDNLDGMMLSGGKNGATRGNDNSHQHPGTSWLPSISFRMVQFGYADRSGPTTRRRSTLPSLNLVGPYSSAGELQASMTRRRSVIEQIADEAIDSAEASSKHVVASTMMNTAAGGVNSGNTGATNNSMVSANTNQTDGHHHHQQQRRRSSYGGGSRRHSAVIRQMLGNEVRESRLGSRVLDCFNLDIKPGQSVALVGPSGSGKSTVLALVQRLYDINSGQLLIGQHDIKDLNLAWLRNQIGLVGQEPRLFDMSIAENIMLGLSQDKFEALVLDADNEDTNDCDALDDDDVDSDETSRTPKLGGRCRKDNEHCDDPWNESGDNCKQRKRRRQDYLMQQVIDAAKAANAHEFIVRLPNGYGTRVGSGGVQLSGGQKQRIAIARALIRQPKILLLDECTSALDTDSEAQVNSALKLSANCSKSMRTTLIVAHRLETIKHVDLIVVMDQGQVVACGTHEELMKAANQTAKGDMNAGAKIYKQLYEEQLQAKQQKLTGGGCGGSGGDSDILEEEEEGEEDADEGEGGKRRQLNQDESAHDSNSDDKKTATTSQIVKPKAKKACANIGAVAAAHQDHLKGSTRTDEKNTTDLAGLAGFDAKDGRPNKIMIKPKADQAFDRNGRESDDDDDDGDDGDIDERAYVDTNRDGGSSAASSTTSSSLSAQERLDIWNLWHFMEIPKWSTLAAVLVCLLAGLILPLNLIAHSYLFSVFAYNELDQIGEYLHVFGLIILSFSTFVFIVSFLQIILPGYVGEKLSVQLRVKTMDCLLQKPMFYFDMDSNSAGAICDRFNRCISHLQSIAGTRVATMLEAVSTLAAGAIFGFGQNFALSTFCLSFALLVLVTTIIESRIVERESCLQQKYDAQLAHLMADALSNIKTIASLNRESFFVQKFNLILKQREQGIGRTLVYLHTFLTSLKFVMPAMSWSASMYYGSYLLTVDRIDLQTIYIVCPVVLFAVNDTFRALVFLPELLKARRSIERLYRMNREFSPEVLQTLTFGQQLAEQNRLHLEQLMAETGYGSASNCLGLLGSNEAPSEHGSQNEPSVERSDTTNLSPSAPDLKLDKPKKSISFVLEPTVELPTSNYSDGVGVEQSDDSMAPSSNCHRLSDQFNRRMSNIQNLPTYMSTRRKSSRLNSLVPGSNARGRIEFDGVEFAYPNRPTALVLDGFTLSIAPGESVALVGASGSGKSTTVAILEKFYDYHGGSVTLDGRDLRLVEPNWVRSQIGLVQQEPCLLSYTIGDNIRYGDNSRFVSMDEVVEAARTANIHDFIMTLPDQYDTELSSSAYSSCQLSGGQRQRIAIARALVRNAPILIFDEATSALDNKSEQVVQDALRKAKRGRTNLTIAHRLSTIKDADKIVVMSDGKVVEAGKHDELIAKQNGLYRLLWARQSDHMISHPADMDTTIE